MKTISKGIYNLKVTINTSLLSGSNSNVFFTNKSTMHGADHFPIIPASSIKGALRIEAEKHLHSSGDNIMKCHSDFVDTLCDKCDACSLFGGREKEAKLIFHLAELSQDVKKVYSKNPRNLYSTKNGVSISRKTRTSVDHALFSETVLAQFGDLMFTSSVEVIDDLSQSESDLFNKAISSLNFLCSGKTRGLGSVSLSLEEQNTTQAPPHLIEATQTPLRLLCELTLNTPSGFRLSKLKQDEYFYETLSYIPGSTIRGAIAKQMQRLSVPEPEIKNLLQNKQLKSSYFYPYARSSDTMNSEISVPKPIPKTIKYCKKNPGWDTVKHHGHQSILIQEIRNHINNVHDDETKCKKCKERLISVSGYYTDEGVTEHHRRIQTRIAIDRSLNCSREGALFSYETIIPPDTQSQLIFSGEIELLQGNQETIECIKKITHLKVGGKTGIGYGDFACKLKLVDENKQADLEKISNNINKFNDQLGKPAKESTKIYFYLTLTSPLSLPYENISKVLSSSLPDCELIYQFADVSYYGGWNSIAKMERNLENAFSPGSVFVFSCAKTISIDQLADKLYQIKRKGLGLKTFEGFGSFEICDEIQLEAN